MFDPPGHPTAGFLSFAILTELIDTLVEAGIIIPADRTALYKRVAEKIGQLPRADSEIAQKFIRDRMIQNK
ncbi:hypothetical protein [Aestuariivirga sp.]|uniref:hypothetical protein n=1 Tax=Aestuariivirga sp. TaxID=2650926 RepID=UPI003BACF945